MHTKADIDRLVDDFNASFDVKTGCEKCGGNLLAVRDGISQDRAESLPILVLDVAHRAEGCTTLTEMPGLHPLGVGDTQIFVRHRFDDGNPIWRCATA